MVHVPVDDIETKNIECLIVSVCAPFTVLYQKETHTKISQIMVPLSPYCKNLFIFLNNVVFTSDLFIVSASKLVPVANLVWFATRVPV